MSEDRVPAGDRRGADAITVVHPEDQHRTEHDEDDAQHEVQTNHVRVQVSEHRNAADHGLKEHAARGDEGEDEKVAPLAAVFQDEEEGSEGDELEDEEQGSVAELDHAVDPHLGGADERFSGTAWPRWAPKAGSCQPDSTTGADQSGLGGEVEPGDDSHPAIDLGRKPVPKSPCCL